MIKENIVQLMRPVISKEMKMGVRVAGDFSHSWRIPSHAGDKGYVGEVSSDKDFVYVCVAADEWQRMAIAPATW
jgi:hypothetical protein